MTERQIELVWACKCGHKSRGRFMECEACGRPKDENVEYEMPERPEEVASVEDEKLLRMAKAGANWSCAYCGSEQRALDGSCERCGAGRKEAKTVEHAREREAREAHGASAARVEARPTRRGMSTGAIVAIVGAVVAMMLLGTCFVAGGKHQAAREPLPVAVAASEPAFVDLDLTVARVHWTRTVMTDQWEIVQREAFEEHIPADAIDKKPMGQRVHHEEQVLDHMDTVYDSVEVPDGTRSETYTEHVACGENCTTTPRSCRQVCKNNKNGFATCNDVCTGGDRSCSTKYCDETRTRQVPKTRTERRPRQVPQYRSEPRYATWFAYRVWDWVERGHVTSEGDDTSPAWPEAGALDLADASANKHDAGTKTRERTTETYGVTLTDDKGASYNYNVDSASAFADYGVGTHHKMRNAYGRLTPL
jgi:hypothetical protein